MTTNTWHKEREHITTSTRRTFNQPEQWQRYHETTTTTTMISMTATTSNTHEREEKTKNQAMLQGFSLPSKSSRCGEGTAKIAAARERQKSPQPKGIARFWCTQLLTGWLPLGSMKSHQRPASSIRAQNLVMSSIRRSKHLSLSSFISEL